VGESGATLHEATTTGTSAPSTTTVAPTPAGGSNRYDDPTGPNGMQLYACSEVGGDKCGRNVALGFCKTQGWVKVGKYAVDNKKVQAVTLAGEVCSKKRCKVFEYIECGN
jgi:hypothetical protein